MMETVTEETTKSDACSRSSYFTSTEWVIYGVVIVTGLLLRWILLDMRPYHHDESLHGMYGRYFYDWPESNYYKYDPMLHGPMLYNCMRFIYATFGDSLWAARIPPCLMGSAFMLMPLLFRNFFKKQSVLLLTAFIALSPTLVYWSRFLREDYWVVSGMLMVVYGFVRAPIKSRSFWVLMGVSIQWCTKENIFVSLAVLVGYLVFEFLFKIIRSDEKDTTIVGRIVRHIGNYPWETCWAFIFAFLVYCWFYSAGFRFHDGITDGLGGKGFSYWMEHHGKERIEGPFNFHTYVLGWYELPFLLAFITHVVLFYRRASAFVLLTFCAAMVAMLIAVECTPAESLRATWGFFKLKDHFDLIGLFILLFHAPLVTIQHLIDRKDRLAGCGYFFTATYFVYSYLGEKVPWLSMYPLIFGLPYLALFFEDYFQKHPCNYTAYPLDKVLLLLGSFAIFLTGIFILEEGAGSVSLKELTSSAAFKDNAPFLGLGSILVICGLFNPMGNYLPRIHLGKWVVGIACLFMLRASIQTNFLYAGKDTEYLSQVHTTYETAEFAQRVEHEALFETKMYKPKVLVTGDATWPLTWYFRHLPNEYRFSATPEEKKNFTYIIQDYKETPEPSDIPEGYVSRKVNLRGWWVPDFKQMTLKKFLRYAINHYPWGGTGFTYVTLLTAKDSGRFIGAQ